MNKKQHNKFTLEISKYHSRLYHILNNKVWVNPLTTITEKETKEEKQYRISRDGYLPLSVSSAGKLFAVQHVFEGLTSNLDVNNILHIRDTCYYGQAIANEYRKEIEGEFSPEEIQYFLDNVDYADLMEDLED